MAKITGIGGAFLRVSDPAALYAWYEEHLGIACRDGSFVFPTDTQRAVVAVAFFPRDSDYFPVSQPAMLNFQVDDLDGILDRLSSAGVPVGRIPSIRGAMNTPMAGSGGSPIRKETALNCGSRRSEPAVLHSLLGDATLRLPGAHSCPIRSHAVFASCSSRGTLIRRNLCSPEFDACAQQAFAQSSFRHHLFRRRRRRFQW